jgi:hypothetical protein
MRANRAQIHNTIFDRMGNMWEFHSPMFAWRILVAVTATFMTGVCFAAPAPAERHATIFYIADTHGVLEPCGCTSDPLGDFARVTALVRATAGKKRSALLVDAGNLLYGPQKLAPKQEPAAKLRAEFLARELVRLPFGGSALGATDLVRGVGAVTPRRLATNLDGAAFVEPSRLTEVGGIKVGVLGIVDPTVARTVGLVAREPGGAAKTEVARLRAAGAEIVILLAPVERAAVRSLAREAGADIVVVGKNVGKGMSRAEAVGGAFLVAPGEELERIGRLDVVLRGPAPRAPGEALVDAGGAAQSRERLTELDRLIERLSGDLARWQHDATADPTFVAGKAHERDDLLAERTRLAGAAWKAPASGSYFTNALVPIQRTLPRDSTLSANLRKLDRAIGEANLALAEPPPPPEPGRAYYVGDAKCTSCHKSAARAWQKTRHAHAWRTLVAVGKQAHDDCVSCHVTGFGEVGGSSLGHTRGLENVQCEACHLPNSIHVEKRGKETPYAGSTKTPEAVCVRCHNEKHSDTFKYEPYLREALGPGHGEDFLDKLGPGPTATQLRRAAAKAAGLAKR